MEEINKKLELLIERTKGLEKLESTISEINKRLINVEGSLKKEVSDLKGRCNEIEKSQKFFSDQYDKNKKITECLIKKDTSLEKENQTLNVRLNALNEQLDNEAAARNADAQHLRSSLNIKICGIPMQDGEETRDNSQANNNTSSEIVATLAVAAKLENFAPDQLDVCHRTNSENANSPIIIRFKTKNDRSRFFSQKKNLNDITLADLNIEQPDDAAVSTDGAARGGHSGLGRGGGHRPTPRPVDGTTRPRIYMQESMTEYNSYLLKEAKVAAQALNYKYAGYFYNGQVRVKMSDSSKFISIKCKSDLKYIK